MRLQEGFIVCNDEEKRRIILNNKELKSYTFLTVAELYKKAYGYVKPKALLYLMDNYKLSYDLASDIMKYIPFINSNSINSDKLEFILKLKEELINKGLLVIDDLFRYRLDKMPIQIIDCDDIDIISIKNVLPNANIIDIKNDKTSYKHEAVRLYDINEECLYVMNKIVDLVKLGVSLNNIYLANLDSEYEVLFKRLANSYNIPIRFNPDKNILSNKKASIFLELCSIKDSFFEIIEELKDFDLLPKIINVINKYEIGDKKPIDYIYLLTEEMKRISYDIDLYDEMVNATGNISFSDDSYVFFLNCNLGSTGRIYKDEEYLNDLELSCNGLKTSYEKNMLEKQRLTSIFTSIKNLYITLKKTYQQSKIEEDVILESLNINIVDSKPELGYSKVEDYLTLAKDYTQYVKYGTISDYLNLYDLKNIRYNDYDNSFKGIDASMVKPPKKLSYSSISTYYKCPFSYYLDKILYVNTFESKLNTRIGNFAHYILEHSYDDDFDFDTAKKEAIKLYSSDLERSKDEFFFNQMAELLPYLIEFNKMHEGNSSLTDCKRELDLSFYIDDIEFNGKIDKLLYKIEDNNAYVVIIDYKTGSQEPVLDNIIDGFNMQLPVYLNLIESYERFKGLNIIIVGIFLQKPNLFTYNMKSSFEAQRNSAFKLQGYCNSDFDTLSILEPDYEDSKYIKSMKITKDGVNKNKKILSDDEFVKIKELVMENIKSAKKKILNAEFSISPVMIDGENKSCMYCSCKDICFYKYDDFRPLPKKPIKVGDDNGVDE